MRRAGRAAGGRASAVPRGRPMIPSACLGALLAGCGPAPAAGRGPSAPAPGGAPAAGPAASTGTPARTPAAGPAEFPDLIDLAGPGFGLAGLGTGPQTGASARLVASANFGRSFTAIGPRTAAWTVTDDVFFLGRQHGWYAVFNVNTLAETLYRTTDGGRTWHAFAAPGHNEADGSRDIVQFLTPGPWLADLHLGHRAGRGPVRHGRRRDQLAPGGQPPARTRSRPPARTRPGHVRARRHDRVAGRRHLQPGALPDPRRRPDLAASRHPRSGRST